MEAALIIFFFTHLFLIAVAFPLYRNKIKLNSWYGIRTKATMTNEEVWYKVNKKGAKEMIQLGAGLSLCCIVQYFTEALNPQVFFISNTLVLLVVVIIIAVKADNYAKRLLKELAE